MLDCPALRMDFLSKNWGRPVRKDRPPGLVLSKSEPTLQFQFASKRQSLVTLHLEAPMVNYAEGVSSYELVAITSLVRSFSQD